MQNPIVRPYEARDREGFSRVRSTTYRGGEPVLPEERILRDDCLGFVGELDSEIVAATTVLDMTATKHGSALRCAGLAAVAVLPERRRSGIGTAMMSALPGMLKKGGFPVASLYPFRASYYRRFGYEYGGARLRITCPGHRLPGVKSDLPVRQLNRDDCHQIRTCYESFAQKYAGMNLRSKEDQWWRVLGGDSPLQVYAAGDPIEGYAVLKLDSDFWTSQNIKEFVWNSREAYEAMICFFRSLAMNKDSIVWNEPRDSPYYARYMDQGATVSYDNNVMFRILDVPSVLRSVQGDAEGEFVIRVIDPLIPENEGPWQVCFSTASTQVNRAAEPGLVMTVGHLTQAFLGDPSFESLARNGSVLAVNDEGVRAALSFFKPDWVYCADYF